MSKLHTRKNQALLLCKQNVNK